LNQDDDRVATHGWLKEPLFVEGFAADAACVHAIATLESHEATTLVPPPSAATIGEVRIKAGNKVSEGSVIATLVVGDAASAPPASAASPPPFSAAALAAVSRVGNRELPRRIRHQFEQSHASDAVRNHGRGGGSI